ncbi:type II toxin-antitoxin system HicB family antitoxin [Curvivirga sp.]|uniref:type II toxin-antitoxin system HicB family antitoxin n=1 Tax=Curvivirga sp. TaxID=2856848 RepID=UPI003B5BA651
MALVGNYKYPARIWEDENGIFQIRFDDLPEIQEQAENLDAALEKAKSCLGDAVADRIQNGQSLPSPSVMEEN